MSYRRPASVPARKLQPGDLTFVYSSFTSTIRDRKRLASLIELGIPFSSALVLAVTPDNRGDVHYYILTATGVTEKYVEYNSYVLISKCET